MYRWGASASGRTLRCDQHPDCWRDPLVVHGHLEWTPPRSSAAPPHRGCSMSEHLGAWESQTGLELEGRLEEKAIFMKSWCTNKCVQKYHRYWSQTTLYDHQEDPGLEHYHLELQEWRWSLSLATLVLEPSFHWEMSQSEFFSHLTAKKKKKKKEQELWILINFISLPRSPASYPRRSQLLIFSFHSCFPRLKKKKIS